MTTELIPQREHLLLRNEIIKGTTLVNGSNGKKLTTDTDKIYWYVEKIGEGIEKPRYKVGDQVFLASGSQGTRPAPNFIDSRYASFHHTCVRMWLPKE